MDVTRINDAQPAARLLEASQDRAAALAEARRRVSQEARQTAEQQLVRQGELLAESREVIAQAIGANTRLSISRGQDAGVFIYRAIDVDTGEVVQEWPPEQFIALLESVEPGAADRLAGLVVDEQA